LTLAGQSAIVQTVVSDTAAKMSLREAREATGFSREFVSRLLDPPVSAKTIERWEKGAKVPRYRLRELALVYRVPLNQLLEAAA